MHRKENKETSLAQKMHDLGKTHMSISLRDYVKNSAPKVRAYKILKNKVEAVVQESVLVWKKEFGLLTPIEKVEKEEEKEEDEEMHLS